MTEAIVSIATEKVSNFIIGEVIFLSGVKQEVARLLAELKRFQSFLKDADQKPNQDERVCNWVAEIRDIAYDTEDTIDYFLLKVARREVPISSFKRIISIFTKGFHLYKLGGQIKSIRTKLGDIEKSILTYGIKFADEGKVSGFKSEMQKRLRRSHPHEEEEGLISLEGSTRDLMAQLMREEDQVRVVSIVGMGGLGKTTLAKKVYNNAEVKRHFDCYSWTSISQQFSVNSILLGILKDVAPLGIGGKKKKKEKEGIKKEKLKEEKEGIRKEELKEEEEENSPLEKANDDEALTSNIYKVLKKKRYLVVLDDIWQIEAWECLKPAFPNGKRGSKILFTTRIKDVALHADRWSSPIELPLLSEEDSWTLFRNKTFPRHIFGENYCISQELEKLGKEMMRKCGGLPLAIVVLGGLLATKESPTEWEVVNRNLAAHFIKLDQKKQYGGVYQILALSYHALPWHLKPCFLYFSLFPEDSEIDRKSLVRMWIAEGFISQPSTVTEHETLEDEGDDCLEELISRSMIQVSSQEPHFDARHQIWRTGHKTCRMHDLMREMCVSKAKEENFLEVMGYNESGEPISTITSFTSRRISIHRDNDSHLCSLVKIGRNPHLRALIYIDQVRRDGSYVNWPSLSMISKNFQLLKVIHIAAVTTGVPRGIGRLIRLRYFKWRIYESLPASIGNLKYLQTLDLRGSFRSSRFSVPLPNVLWKLECLKYLLVDKDDALSCRIDTLRNLETLRWIKAKFLLKNDAIIKLTNLRDLRIVFKTHNNEVEAVLRSPILEQNHLRSLYMVMPGNCAFQNFESISRCRCLSKINLEGTILEDSCPLSLSQLKHLPRSLKKIVLVECNLIKDPMPILEKLPHLTSLHLLNNSYQGPQLVCYAHGFPVLKVLVLYGLRRVEDWRIEKGALPNLKKLIMARLNWLEMVPEGLKSVTTLQLLDISYMLPSFQRRARKISGDDFDNVKHIPHIEFGKPNTYI